MPKIKPREYQAKALNETISSFDSGIIRQLIVMATGLGKTFLAAFLHMHLMPDKPMMFIVDRIELAKQTKDSFKTLFPNKKIQIEMGTKYASKDVDVLVLSIDTWGRKGSERILKYDPDYFKKIVVDEAHTSPTPRYNRVLNYFGVGDKNLKQDRLLMGLTATPNRPDGVGLRKVFDDITCNFDLIWGISNGWLTEVVWYPIDTNVDLNKVKTRGKEFDNKDLSVTVDVSSRNEQIVKAYHEYSAGKRSVAFCASVEHAYHLAELFNSYGVRAETISAQTKKSNRKKFIQGFHDGEIDVLTNFGTLTTGFDETELDSILQARPVKSDLLYRQMIGRGLRPSKTALIDLANSRRQRIRAIENSRKPFCKVVDFVDGYNQHDIQNAPQLFGLHDEVEAQGERMFQDVYEPMKEAELKHGIDISDVRNLDEIELRVKERQRINVRSLEVPKDIKKMSKYSWIEIGEEKWELALYHDSVALLVEVNTIDRYDVFAVDLHTGEKTKLHDRGFGSPQGAINIADQYAEKNHGLDEKENKKLTRHNERWRKYGVTEKQFKAIKKNFKPEIKRGLLEIDEVSEYRDTEVPFIYYNKGEQKKLLKRGTAKELLGNFFTNMKKKRAKKRT